MREMKDSGIDWIGKIPKDWTLSKFKFLGQFINGFAFKPEDWSDEGLPIIRIQDLTGSTDNPNYYNGNLDKKYLVNNGDILISWAATLESFLWTKGHAWLNQHIFKALINNKIVLKDYFIWLSKVAMWNMNNDNKHGIMMQHVTLHVFNNYSVPVPSFTIQCCIARFLDVKCSEIDSLYADIEKQINLLKQYRNILITEAVTVGKEIRFKYIATICSNLVNPMFYQDYPQIAPDSIEKDTAKIIVERTVEEAAVDSWNHLFFKGQIVYSKIRPVLNKVVIAPYDGLCSADMYPIETEQNINFLKYVMLSLYFVESVDLITRDRIKMPKINQDELGNIRVFMPSLTEQLKIVDYLDKKCYEIDSLIADKRRQLEKLETYKNSLIYEFVTGKKEVPL